MNITNLGNGHLTATDKKHITALLQSGHTSAKINRSFWVVIKGDANGNYTFRKTTNDRGWGFIGDQLRSSSYEYNVKIN